MSNSKPTGKKMRLDETAESANSELPAFLSRPEGAPVYHGFALVEETRTGDWCYGAITEFEDPNGCHSGDGFVVTPDGARAGIVWQVGEHEMEEILPPDDKRWGVYAVWFPRATRTMDDLVFNFRYVLPALKQKYEEVKIQKER